MQAVIILVLVIVIVVLVVAYMSKSNSTLSSMSQGTNMQTIAATSITNPTATNFTYSIWFYINGWNYNFDQHKVIFARLLPSAMVNATSSPNTCPSQQDLRNSSPCPLVTLTPFTNDIEISMSVFNENNSEPATAFISNVPIQKWVNLLISVYGRTLDVYMDGKLTKTVVLPGTANIPANENLYITPCGGFDGWTTKFQYFPNATNPQQAWSIYQAGYGASFLSNIMGNTQMSVSLLQNGTPTKTVTI